jgi:hypothetical protein
MRLFGEEFYLWLGLMVLYLYTARATKNQGSFQGPGTESGGGSQGSDSQNGGSIECPGNHSDGCLPAGQSTM